MSCFAFGAPAKTYQLPENSSKAPGWILADLDGDRIADLAATGPGLKVGRDYIHQINVDLTGFQATSFEVHGASPSIRLSFRDLDGDHNRDLVIFEPWSSRPVGVWLNDGSGHFTEASVADYAATIGDSGPRSVSSARATADVSANLHEDRAPTACCATTTYSRARCGDGGNSCCILAPAQTFTFASGPRGPPRRI